MKCGSTEPVTKLFLEQTDEFMERFKTNCDIKLNLKPISSWLLVWNTKNVWVAFSFVPKKEQQVRDSPNKTHNMSCTILSLQTGFWTVRGDFTDPSIKF